MNSTANQNLDATGKHYMTDRKLIEYIVAAADLQKNDVVLEIGYGKGALTKELVKTCVVIAVDIEKNNLDFKSKNLRVIHGNILKEIDALQFTKVVSNIPYAISEPLMRALFKKPFDACILTVGKHFADLLMKADNRIGIIVSHFYIIELLKIVKPESFDPRPNTDSAIIRITPKPLDTISREDALMRRMILLDKKTIRNALETIITFKTKKELRHMLANHTWKSKKIYALTNEEFLEFNALLQTLMRM